LIGTECCDRLRPHAAGSADCPTGSFTLGVAGYRFPPEVIVLAVRWYLRFCLSYRDVEELLAERGIEVDHVSGAPVGAPVRAAAGRCGPVRPAPGRRPVARGRDVREGRRPVGLPVPGGRPVRAGRRVRLSGHQRSPVTPRPVTTYEGDDSRTAEIAVFMPPVLARKETKVAPGGQLGHRRPRLLLSSHPRVLLRRTRGRYKRAVHCRSAAGGVPSLPLSYRARLGARRACA
jgi:hypothetical protein